MLLWCVTPLSLLVYDGAFQQLLALCLDTCFQISYFGILKKLTIILRPVKVLKIINNSTKTLTYLVRRNSR